jgi:hypothetical protein
VSAQAPKPRADNDCRVRITTGQDITYEEYTRALFDRAWDRNQNGRTSVERHE